MRPRPFPANHPGHEFPAWINGKARPVLAPCPDRDCPICAVAEVSR